MGIACLSCGQLVHSNRKPPPLSVSVGGGGCHRELKKSYVIFICTFDPFKKARAKYTFENICADQKDDLLYLNDETYRLFFNTKAYKDSPNEKLKKFLAYIENGLIDEEDVFIKKLEQKIQNIKQNKNWRREYMTFELLQQDKFEQGIEQGVEKNKIQTAQTMLQFQEPIEKIIAYTGLTKEQIEQIQKEI